MAVAQKNLPMGLKGLAFLKWKSLKEAEAKQKAFKEAIRVLISGMSRHGLQTSSPVMATASFTLSRKNGAKE
jgi:hypothetical protein